MQKKRTIGFMFKQINNVYEKEFNNRLRTLGITASQCAVLDYLFDCEKEEVTQRDIEKGLNLRNPTVTGLLKRLDEKGYILSVPSNTDKRCKNISARTASVSLLSSGQEIFNSFARFKTRLTVFLETLQLSAMLC